MACPAVSEVLLSPKTGVPKCRAAAGCQVKLGQAEKLDFYPTNLPICGLFWRNEELGLPMNLRGKTSLPPAGSRITGDLSPGDATVWDALVSMLEFSVLNSGPHGEGTKRWALTEVKRPQRFHPNRCDDFSYKRGSTCVLLRNHHAQVISSQQP